MTRLLTPEERAQFEQQRRLEAEQRAQMLEAQLRSLGIDPETLS